MTTSEAQALIRSLRENRPPLDATFEQMRAGSDARGDGPLAEGVSVTAGSAGPIPGEWHDASAGSGAPVVLYFHGGGYVVGSPISHRPMGSRIARAAQARLFMADYRLAPEHPFPAAADDGFAAYRALLDAGIDSSRLAVGGGSAGGGLALAALVEAHEAALPMPAAWFLISPWADLTLTTPTLDRNEASDPTAFRARLQPMADCYLNGADPRHPRASPLFANFTGLPPLLIQVGSIETLLGDSETLHARAEAARVDSTLEVWPDMVHVWHHYADHLTEADAAAERIGEFLSTHWRAQAAAT